MITATNPELEITITGPTLKSIYSDLCGRLSVSGPRAVTLTTDSGAVIRSSLYSGESFIRCVNGRLIYNS